MQQKSVAIIGAGPAGLVAAKTFLHHASKCFNVSVFERQVQIGGMWAVDTNYQSIGSLQPHMSANHSKYSVAFSDLSWESVDLSRPTDAPLRLGQSGAQGKAPAFPKTWMVSNYLNAYSQKFIPPSSIHTGRVVTKLERSKVGWRLCWSSIDSDKTGDQIFDLVIVASGFFAEPRTHDVFKVKNHAGLPVIINSSRVSSFKDLLKQPPSQGTILVVGGGMSGFEASSKLALEFSNLQYAPDASTTPSSKIKVLNISSRPVYPVPFIVPRQADPSERAPQFAPFDISFYDLSKRKDDPIVPSWANVPPTNARIGHNMVRKVLGSYTGSITGPRTDADLDKPFRLALCSTYEEFLRSQDISTINGRLTSLKLRQDSETPVLEAVINDSERINDVVAVVNATGYTPSPALSFIDSTTMDELEWNNQSTRLPIILQQYQTARQGVNGLGFVGFYEAPYWGIMEMQARMLADQWSSETPDKLIREQHDLEKMRELRETLLTDPSQIAPLWMGDYAGAMEQIRRTLHLHRKELSGSAQPAIPAAYYSIDHDSEDSEATRHDLEQTLQDPTKFVSAAAFRAMQGRWSIHRDLDSALSGFPSGVLTGVAHFHPRHPTSDQYAAEYLYIESGALVTHQGLTMQASRRYAYRYSEIDDQISVWFVKEDGLTIDYLFHTLTIKDNMRGRRGGWHADADHLCSEDMYRTSYEWCFDGVCLETFGIKHGVKGPKKDYVSDTWFERIVD